LKKIDKKEVVNVENIDTDTADEEDNIELKKIDKKEVISSENNKKYSFEIFYKKKTKKFKKQNPELTDN